MPQRGCSKILDAIEVSSANYDTALELLRGRFDNKPLIISNHVNALFNLERVTKDSQDSLRCMLDSISKHCRALKNLGEPVNYWDTLLIHMISNKLDVVTRKDWEAIYSCRTQTKSFDELIDFLKRRCEILESIHNTQYSKPSNVRTSHASIQQKKCFLCDQMHPLYMCDKFKDLTVSNRINKVRQLKLCFNCLRNNHINSNCRITGCKTCGRKHHTSLHLPNAATGNTNNVDIQKQPNVVDGTTAGHASNGSAQQVLLSTATVQLKIQHKIMGNIRALLDSGSQSNFVTDDVVQKFQLKRKPTNIHIFGVNGTDSVIRHEVRFNIKSLFNPFEKTINCLVIPKITENLPYQSFSTSKLEIPSNLNLSDSKFNVSNKIDLLLGADTFYEVMCTGRIKVDESLPPLQNTKLGWVFGGAFIPSNIYASTICNISITNDTLNDNMTKFWELEDCSSTTKFSEQDQMCETIFNENVERLPNGRFCVAIPLKPNASQLGESRLHALKRFYKLEQNLLKNEEVKNLYVSFMTEYEQLGHMKKLSLETLDKLQYYLPHHPVLNNASTSTKLRVVFDGSSKSSSGLSINDVQLVGPTMQSDIFSILIRFRLHKIVLCADIEKMYRQVLIQENQRSLQRIFWRVNPSEQLHCYELNTVTYGTSSAPFLAIRCLFQLGIETEITYPQESNIIKRDFYVDDVLTGADCISDVKRIKQNLNTILASGGFRLCKWLSNYSEVLDFSNTETPIPLLNDDTKEKKTLGIWWNPTNDNLQYVHTIVPQNILVTKRNMMAIIARIYDPLGLLGPVIVIAKILIQQLWQCQVDWDTEVSDNIKIQWLEFYTDLSNLDLLTIPRRVLIDNPSRTEAHGFCDASITAYGACIYLKATNSQGSQIFLLTAKSRVAPLKNQSLPRLELCGALLLTNLFKKVNEAINLNINNWYFWCDSTIVLAWIQSESSLRKTFAANRIAEIQRSTRTHDWRHVKSHDNPADLVSRGLSSKKLMHNSLWWNGPSWLIHNEDEWPTSYVSISEEELPETRKSVNLACKREDFHIFSRYSSLKKLIRVTAYMVRFLVNVSNAENRKYGCLTVEELSDATIRLIRNIQISEFNSEFQSLKRDGFIKTSSKLIRLTPLLDEKGVLRVGGRLNNSGYEYGKKHPILLPHNHCFSKLILENLHIELFHCGPLALLAASREDYWIISGRNLAKQIVAKCVKCFKASPTSVPPIMGSLPESRVTPAPPFTNCGVDYAGPFLIRDKRTRGAKLIKSYICLFVCFATKAIHMELVGDLSTECFLAAFYRFVSRRGKPNHVFSDNGTNFVGASRELGVFMKVQNKTNEFFDNLANQGITWHFIPANSPHMGGLWEAGIKSAKAHLKRVVANASLVYEQFNTVIAQTEAILNSRPISSLSTDPNDLNPLTPAHFLIGRSLLQAPTPDLQDIPQNRLSRYQHVQQIIQHFWARWSKEYVSELQQRAKWTKNCKQQLQPNTIVIIREDNLPPLQWRMGRVVEVHPGDDNIVRVATIRTQRGTVKRAVNKLCALPS